MCVAFEYTDITHSSNDCFLWTESCPLRLSGSFTILARSIFCILSVCPPRIFHNTCRIRLIYVPLSNKHRMCVACEVFFFLKISETPFWRNNDVIITSCVHWAGSTNHLQYLPDPFSTVFILSVCPLCIFHNTSRIHFISVNLIKQVQNVGRVSIFKKISKLSFLPKFQIRNFWWSCVHM